MGMRISLTNNLTANGVRWHVIEWDKILKVGTASTELQARAAAIKVLKEIEIRRFVSAVNIPKLPELLR